VLCQQSLAGGKIEGLAIPDERLPVATGQFVQHVQDSIHGGQDVRLRTSQRGKPQSGQTLLQRAQITAAQREVMQIGMRLNQAC